MPVSVEKVIIIIVLVSYIKKWFMQPNTNNLNLIFDINGCLTRFGQATNRVDISDGIESERVP